MVAVEDEGTGEVISSSRHIKKRHSYYSWDLPSLSLGLFFFSSPEPKAHR